MSFRSLGVLSRLLLLVIVDDLLEKLHEHGFTTRERKLMIFSSDDDLVVTVRGKHDVIIVDISCKLH